MKTDKKKHILVVSQYFYPEQFRINDICIEWVKRGYKVTVLTGIPNYPQGEFYKGYDWSHKRVEEWNGIRIIRIPICKRGHNSIGLILNYFSFVVSGYLWSHITGIKADYVFTFEVSPMTQALVGVWYAKKCKIPHYLYVQDLWPENVEIVTGIHSQFVLKPISKMVDYIYKNSNHIFATSESFVDEIQKRCDNQEIVSYWPQYAEDFYIPKEKSSINIIPENDSFKVIFTGNLGRAQGLSVLPQVAKKMKNEKILFIIVGDGRDKENFLNQIKEAKVEDKFLLIDKQPAERIPSLLACADVAFVSFMDNDLFRKTIPAKLQSYLACGISIIASASGETKKIITEADCGYCAEIGNVDELCQMIGRMMNNRENSLIQGQNGRLYYDKMFNKEKLLDKMDIFLNK